MVGIVGAPPNLPGDPKWCHAGGMTERQRHDVTATYPTFEVRRYPAHLVAEVEVESSFTEAGNRAFRILAGFISGRNTSAGTIPMTAPVVQEEVVQEQASTRIAMTAPVIQESGTREGRHLVAFVMPSGFTLETLPTPVPAQLAAATTFTGRWSERRYDEHLAGLREAVRKAGLEVAGPPRFARFDPPWTPWFLRHNEVVLPIVDA